MCHNAKGEMALSKDKMAFIDKEFHKLCWKYEGEKMKVKKVEAIMAHKDQVIEERERILGNYQRRIEYLEDQSVAVKDLNVLYTEVRKNLKRMQA